MPLITLSYSSLLRTLAVTTLAIGPTVCAEPDFFSDISVSSEEEEAEAAFDFKGFIQQKLKYGFSPTNDNLDHPREKPGLDQLRTDLYAELADELTENWKLRISSKAEINYLRWRDNSAQYKVDETRFFLRDAFIDASFSNGHWLRLGNQVFAWGESESLSISDVLSPVDQREFGQAELQDIREPIPALMYSFPGLTGKLTGVVTYKAGANRYANTRSIFYPYVALNGSGIDIQRQDPSNEWEVAIKYDKPFNGGDFSLLVAELNDNDFVFDGLDNNSLALSQARNTVVSALINRVVDAWLLKAEIGYYQNQAYNIGFEHDHTDQTRAMVGAVYSGWVNWRMSFEINALSDTREQDRANSTDDQQTEAVGYTLHLQQSALNERVDQHFWLIALPNENGQVYRWDLNYDWSDRWAFSANLVLYEGEENSLLYPYRGNDTLNFSAKYNF